MNVDTFLSLVEKYHAHYPEQRRGQAMMNVLHSMHPEAYDYACGHGLDVFYTHDETKIEAFLSYLRTLDK